jgi:hypothetical protein
MAVSSEADSASPHRRSAKDLLRGCRAGEPDALRRFRTYWHEPIEPSLQRCQHVIAKESGAEDWDQLLQRAATSPRVIIGASSPDGFKNVLADPRAAEAILANLSATITLGPPHYSRDLIEQWCRRRGLGLHEEDAEDLAYFLEYLQTHHSASPDAAAWTLATDTHHHRTDAPLWSLCDLLHQPSWSHDHQERHLPGSPFGLPLGMGRWIGGTCPRDVIISMFPRLRRDPYWIPRYQSWFSDAGTEVADLIHRLQPLGFPLIESSKLVVDAVCQMAGHAHQYALTPWLDPDARHPIAVGWQRPNGSPRSLLVSGGIASGKTTWVNRLIEHTQGSVAIVGWDVIGDLKGDTRVPASAWSETMTAPQGTTIIEGGRTRLPRLPRSTVPCLLIINGLCPGDEPGMLTWIRDARHAGNVTVVVAAQVKPEHGLQGVVTDHLAFRDRTASSWPGLPVAPGHLASLAVGQGILRTAEGGLFLVSPNHGLPAVAQASKVGAP